MNEILINGAIVLANCVATSLIGAGTNAILTKRAFKGMEEFENDMEAYEKELQKRRMKVALTSTAITVASAAGLAFGSAFIINEFNAPVAAIETSDSSGCDAAAEE